MNRARVYLVGAGPGAADLLTLRAARLLGEADIVFHDALVPEEILRLAARAELVAVGKRSGRHSTAQRFINKRLAGAAVRHRTVVRLKGGDPMLFGRAHEEIEYLARAGIDVEVVPGVTAALAASAALGVSLTRRGVARSVVFLTPRLGKGECESGWPAAALAADTVAIYMGSGEAAAICHTLLAGGKRADTPVALIESVSLPGATIRRGTLAALPEMASLAAGGPGMILMGEVLRREESGLEILDDDALVA